MIPGGEVSTAVFSSLLFSTFFSIDSSHLVPIKAIVLQGTLYLALSQHLFYLFLLGILVYAFTKSWNDSFLFDFAHMIAKSVFVACDWICLTIKSSIFVNYLTLFVPFVEGSVSQIWWGGGERLPVRALGIHSILFCTMLRWMCEVAIISQTHTSPDNSVSLTPSVDVQVQSEKRREDRRGEKRSCSWHQQWRSTVHSILYTVLRTVQYR